VLGKGQEEGTSPVGTAGGQLHKTVLVLADLVSCTPVSFSAGTHASGRSVSMLVLTILVIAVAMFLMVESLLVALLIRLAVHLFVLVPITEA
jgi:hypothetical protein